jgi:hypothetical protein
MIQACSGGWFRALAASSEKQTEDVQGHGGILPGGDALEPGPFYQKVSGHILFTLRA